MSTGKKAVILGTVMILGGIMSCAVATGADSHGTSKLSALVAMLGVPVVIVGRIVE